ncbi:protein kinase domain-containing protein [Dysosmobacter welbionis]|uniref:protein kinase domain-containing protein n=1 Tax=Dysosmobacter welbionis TaxID=2093857 RepID=UPI003A8D9ED1
MAERKDLCYNCFQEREAPEGPCPYCGFDLAENEKKFPVALRAGTVLNDRYIVGRVLGQGGFGITYLALDTQLNAKVAIKEFMPNDIATRIGTTVSVAMDTKSGEFAYGAERFQEEARTLAKFIGNPNIAAVTSYFDENDTSYFVMDYIEGISFKTYIANHGGKISVEETLNVMIPVLRALTAVHAEGFIHRDVTPDNIYITKDGMVKLLDFGSARYSIGDKSKSLDVILKVGYAPKEQYIRRSRQGPFTDVYSCAACFYAAITGFLPPESLERMDHDELVPVSQCGIEIPEYLDKAILKGLAVQPEDRFQNAQEFLDAIESQQVVEVPVSGGAAAPTPEKKKIKPALIAAIAAAVVVAVGIGIAIGGGGRETTDGGGGGNPVAEALAPKVTIAGQEYSAALTQLFLDDVLVDEADFQNLQEMKNLEYLSYTDGRDELDLSFVSGLPNLQMLSAHGYYVDLNLASLADLKNLTELHIYAEGSNNISRTVDLSPLENLVNLQYIQLDCVPDSYEPLAGLKSLQQLILWNPISGQGDYEYSLSDLSPLEGLTELTYLNIPIGDVEDLNSLSGLTKLTDLLLYGNAHTWEDISFLRPLTNLQRLALDNQVLHLQDLSDLSGLTELRELSLNLEGMGSLDGLEHLTHLQELQLSADFAAGAEPDLSPLSGLTALTTLRLYLPYDVSVSLEPLGALTQLRDLEFNGNVRSNNLSPLGDLTSLQSIRVQSDNYQDPFDDLSPFANLEQLNSLEIQHVADNIDLSPVEHVPNVRTG